VAVFLSVMSSLMVGLILLLAPWTTLWEANYLLQPHPTLRTLLLNPFVRGLVSGVGLVNIVLALNEVRYVVASRVGARRG
jgi:hypothetical protein